MVTTTKKISEVVETDFKPLYSTEKTVSEIKDSGWRSIDVENVQLNADELNEIEEKAKKYRNDLLRDSLKAKIALMRRLKVAAYMNSLEKPKQVENFTMEQYRETVMPVLGNLVGVVKDFEYKLHENNRFMLEVLCAYFARDERFYKLLNEAVDASGQRRFVLEGEISLDKGIAIFGHTGVGKTILLKAFSQNPRLSYNYVKAKHLPEAFAAEGFAGLTRYYKSSVGIADRHYGQSQIGSMFDDVGEELIGRHFGNEQETLVSIMNERWENLPGFYTHFTTNISRKLMEARYGSRFLSRLYGKMNLLFFPLDTPDFRRD